jgi:SAM-dependent methyltransferase
VILGQRFARFVTDVVVRRPMLWHLLRPLTRRQFDSLAPIWEGRRRPDAFDVAHTALDAYDGQPERILDVGTGTGFVARLLAERFPDAEIVGVDLAPRMVEQARALTDAPKVRYEVADASRLPFADGSFELVTLSNMIPFFDELARVVAPGGAVMFLFTGGSGTPIYVPPERLRRELGRRGFAEFAEHSAGRGTALTARKQ